jgi:hypothetical protein
VSFCKLIAVPSADTLVPRFVRPQKLLIKSTTATIASIACKYKVQSIQSDVEPKRAAAFATLRRASATVRDRNDE